MIVIDMLLQSARCSQVALTPSILLQIACNTWLALRHLSDPATPGWPCDICLTMQHLAGPAQQLPLCRFGSDSCVYQPAVQPASPPSARRAASEGQSPWARDIAQHDENTPASPSNTDYFLNALMQPDAVLRRLALNDQATAA